MLTLTCPAMVITLKIERKEEIAINDSAWGHCALLVSLRCRTALACRPAHCVSPGGKAAIGGNSRLRNSDSCRVLTCQYHISRVGPLKAVKSKDKLMNLDLLSLDIVKNAFEAIIFTCDTIRMSNHSIRNTNPLQQPAVVTTTPVLLSHCSLFKSGRWRLVICSHPSIVRKTLCFVDPTTLLCKSKK